MNFKSLITTTLLLLGLTQYTNAQVITVDELVTSCPDQQPFTSMEQNPTFRGGESELMKYLEKELDETQRILKDSTQHEIVVKFTVCANGQILNCKIINGENKYIYNSQKIINVIEGMPAWNPGKLNNKNVPVYYTLPIKIFVSEKLQTILDVMDLGNNYLAKEQYKEAMNEYKKVLAINSTFTDALLKYADILVVDKKNEEAVDIFEKQYQIAPENLSSIEYIYWGDALRNLHLLDEAIEKYQIAISMDYKSIAHQNLGITYYDLNKYNAALNQFQKVISLQKATSETYKYLGNIASSLNDYFSAVKMYKLAISEYNNGSAIIDVSPEVDLAALYAMIASQEMKYGDYIDAIEYLQISIKNTENTPYEEIDYYYLIAECFINIGRENIAIDAFKKILEIAPHEEKYKIELADLYIKVGNEKEAKKLLKKIESKKNSKIEYTF